MKCVFFIFNSFQIQKSGQRQRLIRIVSLDRKGSIDYDNNNQKELLYR